MSELSERLSVGSLDLSSTSSSDAEEEEEVQEVVQVGGVVQENMEEHDQEYTIYQHIPLRRESSQFSIIGESTRFRYATFLKIVAWDFLVRGFLQAYQQNRNFKK